MSDRKSRTIDHEESLQQPAGIASHDAAAGSLHAAARESILHAPHVLWLLADRNLVVRETWGNPQLIRREGPWIGERLLDVAPELRGRESDLEALLAGRLERLDCGLVRPAIGRDHAIVWAQTTAAREPDGTVQGVIHMLAEASALGAMRERSERQRRELAELRHRLSQISMDAVLAQTELKGLDDAKTQFLFVAAHELRNPLASLIGYLELLESEGVQAIGEPQRSYLDGIRRGAQRLRVLTSNLLDLTRIDSNRLELVMSVCEPIELIVQAVSEMQSLFDAKRQRIILKGEPALPRVWCDRQRCSQVLANLLSNAHKYTPPGGAITVQARRFKKQPMVCISVKDTGIGIPPEDQNRIFTRFYRAGNAGAADGSGAGLGLTISQSIVRLHGGKLWFESKPDKGTTFFLTLRAAE